MFIQNIIVGKPLVELSELGIIDDEVTIFEEERFLPRLLVKHEFFKSTSEIKKNRPDLWRELIKPEFTEISIGKKKFWLLVGN